MLIPGGLITLIAAVVAALVVGAVIGFYYNKSQVETRQKDTQQKAEIILQKAKETARSVEIQAKDDALKILKNSEEEVSRRRAELSREEDRLQKRRVELDNRVERMEQRDQLLSKRQSALDKRSNDVEKMYSQQMEELQKIGQMTTEEARQVLLAEVEKDSRADMASTAPRFCQG